jgi:hypothetical protein
VIRLPRARASGLVETVCLPCRDARLVVGRLILKLTDLTAVSLLSRVITVVLVLRRFHQSDAVFEDMSGSSPTYQA